MTTHNPESNPHRVMHPLDEVANLAWLSHIVVQDAFLDGRLTGSIRRVAKAFNIPMDILVPSDIASVVSLLYCTISIPMKVFFTTPASVERLPFRIGDVLKHITITRYPPDFETQPLFDILRRIGRAVAHARFSIDVNSDFTLWDLDDKAVEIFRARFAGTQLDDFLNEICSKIAALPFLSKD